MPRLTIRGMAVPNDRGVAGKYLTAMEESRVNPFSDGFSTLAQLVMEQDLVTGGDDNIFGNTVESSLSATKKILDRIENPLGKVDKNKAESLQREKKFYSTLLGKLEKI